MLYENSIKLPSKRDLSLNRPGHLLTLGANHLLHIIGVDFQLYGQLKKSSHDSMGVLGSTAVSTVSQATRLGKGSISQMVTYLVCDELKYGFKSAYEQS